MRDGARAVVGPGAAEGRGSAGRYGEVRRQACWSQHATADLVAWATAGARPRLEARPRFGADSVRRVKELRGVTVLARSRPAARQSTAQVANARSGRRAGHLFAGPGPTAAGSRGDLPTSLRRGPGSSASFQVYQQRDWRPPVHLRAHRREPRQGRSKHTGLHLTSADRRVGRVRRRDASGRLVGRPRRERRLRT